MIITTITALIAVVLIGILVMSFEETGDVTSMPPLIEEKVEAPEKHYVPISSCTRQGDAYWDIVIMCSGDTISFKRITD